MSRREDSFEHYGPDGPSDDRTGNEIVNNGPNHGPNDGPNHNRPDNRPDDGPDNRPDDGPDNRPDDGPDNRPDDGPNGLRRDGDLGRSMGGDMDGEGIGLGAGLGSGLGSGVDEDALRLLLHGAVDDIQPSVGALDHLRRAVPARRARKRQALVGMAAAALLVGTAVPAFVHVANSSGSEKAAPVNAGHGQQSQGGAGNDPGVTGGENGTEGPEQGAGDTVRPDESSGPDPSAGRPTGGVGDGASGSVKTPAAGEVQACTAAQLSVAGMAGSPDAEGKVYGTFRITNVSGTECSVGPSTVGFQAMGAADATRIGVTRHVPGDAAGGLPGAGADSAVVQAAQAFETKFAWVPSGTCPTTGNPSPDPSPSEGDTSVSGGGQGGTGSSDSSGVQPQLMRTDGVQDGSVAVMYSTLGGQVSGQTTVVNACAGTIYYTGVLPG